MTHRCQVLGQKSFSFLCVVRLLILLMDKSEAVDNYEVWFEVSCGRDA